MIGDLLHYKDEDMPLIVQNKISQTTTTTTGPYHFHEISHNQTGKQLPYVLNSLTNSIFEVLNRRWACSTDSAGTKSVPNSQTLRMEKLFNNNSWIFESQMRQFCLLTNSPRLKWASSLKMIFRQNFGSFSCISRTQSAKTRLC